MVKKRLDQLLVDKKIVESREKGKRLIIAKQIQVNNQYILKPGTMVDINSEIILIKSDTEFVSRAGDKLNKALKEFQINVKNSIAMDIGSSTGGFTDCLLQNQAKLIYAIDVGYNQLCWKIRQNPQVIVMEKTNFRYCKKADFNHQINFACCDVSFISLKLIIPIIEKIISNNGDIVLLIKPQFEASSKDVHKGKINDPKIHKEVIKKIWNLSNLYHFSVFGLTYSPILGNKKKNIEYIIWLKKTTKVKNNINSTNINNIVDNAWKKLVNK